MQTMKNIKESIIIKMKKQILWFRRDLRVEDNPLLAQDANVLPIFIFDTTILSKLSHNDRRATFIFHAVSRLKASLKKRGLDLALFYGDPKEVFQWLLEKESFTEVVASGDYDSYALSRDREISFLLPFHYVHDTYIFRPEEVMKSDGSAYLVFTPYYNKSKTLFTPEHLREISPHKQSLIPFNYEPLYRFTESSVLEIPFELSSIGFEKQTLEPHQLSSPMEKLEEFGTKLSGYPHERDFMIEDATSHLSIDLRFGLISVRAVLRWLSVQKKRGIDTEPFFRQLVFRDFYAMLLYHFPHLETQNFRYRFKGVENNEYFERFQSGTTGVPIVDAGIRQLLNSGEMHNRIRMIVASFFTKNLLLPWQWGEAFFAQHLMDYEASSNILSWQWSAGTGVDPQPYFRIFNPYTQTAKFDKNGSYIKKHLLEVVDIAPKILANEEALNRSFSTAYPKPMLNHKESSKKALEYFKHSL